MRKIITKLLIFILGTLSIIFSQNDGVLLTIDNVDGDNQTLDIFYSSLEDIAGFQFDVEGVTLTSASGGDAEENGLSISFTSTVLGFSFTGATIDPGEGVLVVLEVTGDGDACLSGLVISDSNGDAIEDFFSQNYNDNLSYEFFANIEYRPTINEYKPYAILTYKMYETKSTFTFDSLTKFSSESSVTTLSLGCETPKLFEFDANSITLEGYYNANYLSGTVKDVVGFDTYSSLGGVVYYNTPDKPWWASRFFFEASTVSSSGLEGYNIGVGFTLDF